VQGFRVTSVTRTLVDLAGIVSEADLRATVDEALNRKRTTIDRLAVALVEHASVAGVSALREIVREYQGGDGPCESELEARVFELLDRSGLPRPTRQRSITVAGRLRRLDFLFPDHDVIVEADGYATHATPMAFEKDRQRANSLTSRGFRVLQWTWRSLHDRPGELLRELKAVLDAQASRGGRSLFASGRAERESSPPATVG
jgi:very-short-patch-repair endonuclease